MSKKVKISGKVAKIIREVLEEKETCVECSLEEMMEKLSKEIKKPVLRDDKGNYNVCECEPHHISIRPITQDIFDLQYYKDGSDREKKLYVPFEEVKKLLKAWLSSEDPNYVDSAYEKNIENSQDKEGGKKADKESEEIIIVDPEKDNKRVKAPKAKDMNDKKDNPDQPMREIGKVKKQVDHKAVKSSYKPPVLSNNLQKLVIKYTKNGKQRKQKNK